ncbi:unnamed protein product [Kluyveromyces dobzhanskii CBS 2104]|uniref:WGS project CCBQ000000000 data, contig 00099 n=1 Tax=Kluyveromyces dobzhanskii CBS 2104 TaxID=1427455 RepID=A0A0A8L2J3_9SACH|nr:unnamed protein product [Kluyveromyces dobzhanskii CBS 2104]
MKFVEKWLPVYIKAWIQLIWYHRDIYPRETFSWTNYHVFNLPNHIPVTVNPELLKYVDELCDDLLDKLKQLHYLNFYVCEYDDENYVIERYCLDFGDINHLDKTEGSTDQENVVFDEFRSSIHSLIAYLEKLPLLEPGKYTFDIVIETVEMSLGHMSNENLPRTKENMGKLERDWNWIKYKDPSNDFSTANDTRQRVKMYSLVGCDLNSMVFHQFAERIVPQDSNISASIE